MSEIFAQLSRNIAGWSHRHQSGESRFEYEARFIGCCDTCRRRAEDAVEAGKTCAKHPGTLFEPATAKTPAWCELCEIEELDFKRRAERYVQRLQLEQVAADEPLLPNHMVQVVMRAYIDSARENGGRS